MSIFKKDCPECASPNAIDAVACRCGYCFDPEALAGTRASEYAEQQDRLYQDYLAARIVQAEVELTVAREQAKADAENTYKAAAALLAEQALNALRAEMKQLSLRLPATPRTLAPLATRTQPVQKSLPVKTVVAPPAPVAVKPYAVSKSIPTKTEKQLPVKKPVAVVAPPVLANRPVLATKIDAPRQAIRTPAPVKQYPAPVRQNLEPAKQRAVSAPKHKLAAPLSARAATPTAPKAHARSVSATANPTVPPESFKRLQAQKADAIARTKASAPAQKPKPAVAAKPAAAPSADIPPLTLAAPKARTTQECPNCTATLALDVERCGCGYAFARPSEQVPALSLDATSLAILTQGVFSTRRR